MDMTLVVMAAGLGSRYGGVKQIERLGPDGEILMEYAIYDALRAGFDRIVLIIKPQMLQDVRALFGDRIEQRTGIRIDYAFQTPERFTAARPELAQRQKPLGTVHAVLCARDAIETPFAVINADDFYGRGAIDAIAAALPELRGAQDAAMVGYRLKNTVSPFGTVTRGVCATENGLLRKVHETYKIQLCPDGTIRDTSGEGEGVALDPEALVSMNMWGYHPAMLDVMAQYFDAFVRNLAPGDEKRECLLPVMMDALTAQGRVNTRVLQTSERWFGLTYQDDKPGVVAALRALHADVSPGAVEVNLPKLPIAAICPIAAISLQISNGFLSVSRYDKVTKVSGGTRDGRDAAHRRIRRLADEGHAAGRAAAVSFSHRPVRGTTRRSARRGDEQVRLRRDLAQGRHARAARPRPRPPL